MTHHEGRIRDRGAFDGFARGSRVIYQVMAFFVLMAGLLAASTAYAQAGLSPGHPEDGRAAAGPGPAKNIAMNPGISALSDGDPAEAQANQATRTPRPTSTPPVIPPPASATTTSLMITLAVVIMEVIFAGICITRRRAF